MTRHLGYEWGTPEQAPTVDGFKLRPERHEELMRYIYTRILSISYRSGAPVGRRALSRTQRGLCHRLVGRVLRELSARPEEDVVQTHRWMYQENREGSWKASRDHSRDDQAWTDNR